LADYKKFSRLQGSVGGITGGFLKESLGYFACLTIPGESTGVAPEKQNLQNIPI